jgi:hypothetical protein
MYDYIETIKSTNKTYIITNDLKYKENITINDDILTLSSIVTSSSEPIINYKLYNKDINIKLMGKISDFYKKENAILLLGLMVSLKNNKIILQHFILFLNLLYTTNYYKQNIKGIFYIKEDANIILLQKFTKDTISHFINNTEIKYIKIDNNNINTISKTASTNIDITNRFLLLEITDNNKETDDKKEETTIEIIKDKDKDTIKNKTYDVNNISIDELNTYLDDLKTKEINELHSINDDNVYDINENNLSNLLKQNFEDLYNYLSEYSNYTHDYDSLENYNFTLNTLKYIDEFDTIEKLFNKMSKFIDCIKGQAIYNKINSIYYILNNYIKENLKSMSHIYILKSMNKNKKFNLNKCKCTDDLIKQTENDLLKDNNTPELYFIMIFFINMIAYFDDFHDLLNVLKKTPDILQINSLIDKFKQKPPLKTLKLSKDMLNTVCANKTEILTEFIEYNEKFLNKLKFTLLYFVNKTEDNTKGIHNVLFMFINVYYKGLNCISSIHTLLYRIILLGNVYENMYFLMTFGFKHSDITQNHLCISVHNFTENDPFLPQIITDIKTYINKTYNSITGWQTKMIKPEEVCKRQMLYYYLNVYNDKILNVLLDINKLLADPNGEYITLAKKFLE